MDDNPAERARIVSIGVRSYKNLRDISLTWSDGLAIFGANGSGKSNLLEAVTVLLGDEDSVRALHGRVQDVEPGALEAVIEVPASELPWPPDVVARVEPGQEALGPRWLGVLRAIQDRAWWTLLGVSDGEDFLAGLTRLNLPEVVVDYLAAQLVRPVIRYTLTRADYERSVIAGEEQTTLQRTYDRTLLGTPPPVEVRALANSLPDAFAPLRSALASVLDGDLVDLIALPPVVDMPCVLQWLPSSRSSLDTDAALTDAFREALRPTALLAQAIGDLDIARQHDGGTPAPEPEWWLHDVIVRAVNDELAQTMPGHIQVEAWHDGDPDIVLLDLRNDKAVLSRNGDENMLDVLSAGERRWVDEALAAATREVQAFGERANAYQHLLAAIDPDRILPELTKVADEAAELVHQYDMLNGEALQAVLDAVSPVLEDEARRLLTSSDDALHQSLYEGVYGLEALRGRLTVRVVDEPEAHLHAGAQRVVSRALETSRRAGDSVCIATHSPHFLDLSDWKLVHLQRTPEGSTVDALTPGDLDARKALAGQMGFTRGELLARIALVLIVEGEHDRLVLETLFGDELDAYGVGVLRMHGTNHILATAELDFIGRYLDVPVAVLTDYTRVDRVKDGKVKTDSLNDEEQKLRKLRQAVRKRGGALELFGLERPDITAYLNPDAVTEHNSAFPGWNRVLADFKRRTVRPQFKDWLLREYQTDLRYGQHIGTVLDTMQTRDLAPERELEVRVQEILDFAATGRRREPKD